MDSGRNVLQLALTGLLGLDEDSASDVLDNLLTIDSREDLLEYMLQLLGDESDTVIQFVENVGRYQRGEPVKGGDETKEQNESKPVDNSKSLEVKAGTMAKQQKQQQQQQQKLNQKPKQQQQQAQSKRSNTIQARRNQKQAKSRVPPPSKSKMNAAQVTPNKNPPKTAPSITKNTSKHQQQNLEQEDKPVSAPRPVQKSNPSRGKAKIVCGCFGVVHEPLTNCLYCGRISCAQEGYDFCPFCGLMVEQVLDDGSHLDDPAWMQKERLLRFDRDFARRTKVVDDQADYQPSESSAWLTEDENKQAEEMSMKQQQIGKRQNQTLKLTI